MNSIGERIVNLRKKGWNYSQISNAVNRDSTTVWGYLKAAGMVRSYKKTSTASTRARAATVAPTATKTPSNLNGLTRVWIKADKLIARAKQIKAAVRQLNKALHG